MIDRNLLVLASIVFIDMAGIGLIVPVMPSLIQSLTGEGIDQAATWGGWLLFSYAMMQFLFVPVIGGLSAAKSPARDVRTGLSCYPGSAIRNDRAG